MKQQKAHGYNLLYMSPENCIYKLEKICKTYIRGEQELKILKDLDFCVYKGQSLCIMGASGAGKSTLLHIMGTLDRVTSGSLFYRDQNITDLSSSELAFLRQKKIGFVFQFHYLLSEFTALENIMLPAHIAKIPYKQALEKAEFLIKALDIYQRKDHYPSELSGGEQQRVAIARALINQPEILLADEPAGNLDKENSIKIQELFLKLHEQFHLTLVTVSHDISFANSFPIIYKMEDGKIRNLKMS